MKSMVVYSSQSGNTGMLAQAVYETLASEKAIYPVGEAPEPDGSDLVAVGFWLQAGQPDPQTQAYLKKIGRQKVFLFATHGAAADSEHARQAMASAQQLLPEADIIGQFNCQGQVNPKVLEKVAKKQPPPAWLKDAPQAAGHPNQNDLDRLQAMLNECLDRL
jgi:flavodoxin